MQARILQRHETAPTDARQVRSRKALTGAMLELLGQVPFDHITIREITARARTGYATFFRHYPDKDALLGDVAAQEIADLLELTLPILDSTSSAESTLALCRRVAQHRKLWSALLTGGAAGIVREEFIRQARGLAVGTSPPQGWLPADLAVVYGTGATIDLLAWWLEHPGQHSAEEMAGILDRLVIAPLVGGRLPGRKPPAS
jgi:AcrR family transcriptional regulator